MKRRLGRLKEGRAERLFSDERQKRKKEEFPGIMENMLPGNSFPQICVVSVNQSVEIAYVTQEYRRSVDVSNHNGLLIDNRVVRMARCRSVAALTVAAVNEEGARRLRMVQHAHGELNAVVRASLAHQAAHMGLHGALLDAQMAGDLSIGTGLQDQVQDLALAVGQVGVAVGEPGIGNLEQAVDEFGEEPARRPDGAAGNHLDGHTHRLGTGGQFQVGPGPGTDRTEDQSVVALRADHNQLKRGTRAANVLQYLQPAGGRMQVD